MKDADDTEVHSDMHASQSETPAERRRRKVRNKIIEVAEDVFAVDGEEGLSMRRLAEAIDYSPAAIYKYFKSKDELLDEIREQFYVRLHERLESSVKPGGYDKAGFCDFAQAYIETGIESPNHYRMAFLSYRGAQPVRGAAQVHVSAWYNDYIAELIARGVFAPADPTMTATSIWASLHGLTKLLAWTSQANLDTSENPLLGFTQDAMVDFHVEALFRSFKA